MKKFLVVFVLASIVVISNAEAGATHNQISGNATAAVATVIQPKIFRFAEKLAGVSRLTWYASREGFFSSRWQKGNDECLLEITWDGAINLLCPSIFENKKKVLCEDWSK